MTMTMNIGCAGVCVFKHPPMHEHVRDTRTKQELGLWMITVEGARRRDQTSCSIKKSCKCTHLAWVHASLAWVHPSLAWPGAPDGP